MELSNSERAHGAYEKGGSVDASSLNLSKQGAGRSTG